MDMSSMSMSMASAASSAVSSAMSMAMASATSSAMAMGTSTATQAAASATSTASSMSMSMGGSSSSGASCKISMLWNWYTIDSCFIARSWHVRSRGGFAGTCIGILFMCVVIELVRRLQREYDRYLLANHFKRLGAGGLSTNSGAMSPEGSTDGVVKGGFEQSLTAKIMVPTARTPDVFVPNIFQQAIRAFFYLLQYAGAYFVMLFAMYYNGYVIICIFLGGFIGNFLFGADSFQDAGIKTQKTCCC